MISLAKLHELCYAHRTCMIVKPCGHGPHRDLGSFFDRIPVHAGADGRETDGPNIACGGQFQAVKIAGFKQRWLTMLPIPVHRPDGVEHVFGWQPPRARHNGTSRIAPANTSADLIELTHDLRTASPVNRSIDPASSGQLRVRSVHNCIYGDSRDITLQ